MTSRICLVVLVVLTITSTLADNESGTDLNTKVRDHGWECANNSDCSPTVGKTTKKPPQCYANEDCKKGELCHKILRVCFVKPSKPSGMRTGKTVTAPRCKTDSECGQNQSCHVFFERCVSNPVVPTTTNQDAATTQACQESSECPNGKYCHSFFNMCLPYLNYSFEPTRPSVVAGCSSDVECMRGEFCHNLTRLCLKIPAIPSRAPSPTKGSYSCKTHADCKMSEFCHFLMGVHRRQKRNKYKQFKSSAVFGVCIALKNVPDDSRPLPSNCSRRSDCEKGRCCLSGLGLCARYRLPGELCVAQDVSFPFSCPCIAGFTCKSKGHKMRLRKLEKKLDLPKDSRERLGFHLEKSIRVKIGKCQLAPA